MPKNRQATEGDDLAMLACPDPDYDLFNRFDAGNLTVVEQMGKNNAIRRLYCNHCQRRFSEHQDSLIEYAKLPQDTVVRIIKCLEHGCSVEVTADVCEGIRTVSDTLLLTPGRGAVAS